MSEEQLSILKNLSKKRVRIFTAGSSVCFAIWLKLAFPIMRFWHLINYELPYTTFKFEVYGKTNDRFMSIIALFLGLLCFFAILFYKSIYLLFKDIRHKELLIEPLQITRKTNPYPNRYFFYLNSLKPPYVEVDAQIYYQYREGETINIHKAKFSKIHLDKYLNIPLL